MAVTARVAVSWAFRIANAILVAAILGTLISWGFGSSENSPAAWVFAYALLGMLFVAMLLVLVLLVHAVAARTIAFLKWPFVLSVLTCLVLSVSKDVSDRLAGRDTVALRLVNESGGAIQWVDVFGRGESVRLDSVPAAPGVVVSYRGRRNDYRARDRYSNRIGVSWVAGGRRRERILVGEAVVIGDSLVIVFRAPDSVVVK